MLLATLLLGLVPNPAPAPTPSLAQGGIRADLLPAETRYVAHVDLRAILGSRLWRELAGPEAEAQLRESEQVQQLRTQLGLDPFADVHSVTVFGSSPDEDSAAVLVRGTKALENGLRRIEGMDGYTKVEVEGLSVHLFDQDGELTYLYSHDDLPAGEGLVVLSPSRTELLRAALVLRGGRDSLQALAARSETPVGLDLAAPSGTFLHVAFSGSIPELGDDPVSSVLRSARGGVFSVGESRDELLLHLGLVTASEDQAFEMADAVDGLKSLGNMLLRNMDEVPQEARQLLRAFRVNNDDATVFVDFTYPLSDLVRLAEENGLNR